MNPVNPTKPEILDKKTFALIGAAGYVAPRHMRAILDTGNDLTAVLDKFDSVGILDNYFPQADFFTEYERFDRHIDKIRRTGKKIDYISICTPNYLHDSHIRFALRQQADAVCEKPLVLNPWNVDALQEIENETGKKINTILQLRLHPVIIKLRDKINQLSEEKIHDITLTYITSRGSWYFRSWKGDIQKSGGIAGNIGIHFFDMLTWIFGDIQHNIVHLMQADKAAGFLQLKNARVMWFLSIDSADLPKSAKENNQKTFRSINIDNEELEFSDGFTDLHTLSYREILKGNGFSLKEAKTSVQTVYEIRNTNPIGNKGDYHPFLRNRI
jgi:UDP-N-acetyl-2-amino-2-deoxyglucuronate dehydrogenase